ncbi:MAG TPA: iron-containing redox enzyme family protein [Blastocatellia bacterium]|nr:iron-containing redox enzyme family protein [Blastocatellia bacterium]
MGDPATTTSGTSILDELSAIVREHSFRDPMLEAVRHGSMSRAGVRRWTLQASLVVREFTRFISAIHANCPDRDSQQLLAENLWEEHGRGVADRDHYALVRKLARSLGASDAEIDNAKPLAETTMYIEHCFDVTRNGSFVESMTALGIGVESFVPAFFGRMAGHLSSNYGLSREDVQYLLVHVTEDETHARRALEVIEAHANTSELREKAKKALREMLAVKRTFSEAVYRYCLCAG